MTKIKEYTKKDGTKLYRFAFYAGTDDLTGKKKYIHKQGFKTLKEARLALSRLEVKKETGALSRTTGGNLTFGVVATRYMELKRPSLRESTYLVQANMLKKIIATLGNIQVKKIKEYHCQNAINQWYKEAPATVSNIKILANQVFKYAIKQRFISYNPMDGVILPKKAEKKREDNYYTKQELTDFLEFVKSDRPGYYPLFRLLAYSGMRIGETLALTWDDIDLENGTVSINKTLSRVSYDGVTGVSDTKTRAGIRTISLDAITLKVLSSHQQAQKKRLFALGLLNNLPQPLPVFDKGMGSDHNKGQGQRYKRINDIRQVLQRLYSRMPQGFKQITLHGFRHTHATLLIEAGATVKSVQQRLGHANINMTLGIYAHATKKMEADAINRLSLYMEN